MKVKDIDVSKYIKPNLAKARKRNKEVIEYLKFSIDNIQKELGLNKTYWVETYGCQGNEADSEIISGILELLGYTKAQKRNEADCIIINTCAIRETAEIKVWGVIGSLKALKTENPDLIIGVCGCMVQEETTVEKLLKTYQQVDLIFGTHNIYKLPQYIHDAIFAKERVCEVYSIEGKIIENLPKTRTNNVKAWVNIMFGCDEFCTYCIVPYTRGKERSRKKDEIINELKELKAQGYMEVTLLGQNVNAYGKDFTDINYTFGDLLYDLDKIGIPRIRFTTSHPHDLDLKTMNAMNDCKSVMPCFHLPVQSGSNNVLKKMNRVYTKETYLKTLTQLKEIVPGISVTTDIIVGFPNETDEDFLQTIDLVLKADFEGAYTFIYSKRSGTPAALFEDVTTAETKKERLLTLNQLINQQYLKGNKRFEKKVVQVLVEGVSRTSKDVLSGYSEHQKLVNFKGDSSLIGKIVNVKITEAKTWHMFGVLVND